MNAIAQDKLKDAAETVTAEVDAKRSVSGSDFGAFSEKLKQFATAIREIKNRRVLNRNKESH